MLAEVVLVIEVFRIVEKIITITYSLFKRRIARNNRRNVTTSIVGGIERKISLLFVTRQHKGSRSDDLICNGRRPT